MFYDRFLALCERKGVTPSRAAIEAGISKSLVSKWKVNEAKEPSPEVVRKLADYFGVSNYEIIEDLPNKKEKAPTPEGERPITFDDFTYAMYEEGRELTEMDKQILLSMAKQLNDARKKQDGEPG